MKRKKLIELLAWGFECKYDEILTMFSLLGLDAPTEFELYHFTHLTGQSLYPTPDEGILAILKSICLLNTSITGTGSLITKVDEIFPLNFVEHKQFGPLYLSSPLPWYFYPISRQDKTRHLTRIREHGEWSLVSKQALKHFVLNTEIDPSIRQSRLIQLKSWISFMREANYHVGLVESVPSCCMLNGLDQCTYYLGDPSDLFFRSANHRLPIGVQFSDIPIIANCFCEFWTMWYSIPEHTRSKIDVINYLEGLASETEKMLTTHQLTLS